MRRLLYHILAGFRQTLGHGGAKVADRAESDGAIELVAALSLRAQCGAGAGASQCAKNEVNALLCVKLDTKQCEHYGNEDFCSMLSLMSKHPMVLCDAALKEILVAGAAAAEIEPSFLQLDADGKSGNLSYMSGAVGETLPGRC